MNRLSSRLTAAIFCCAASIAQASAQTPAPASAAQADSARQAFCGIALEDYTKLLTSPLTGEGRGGNAITYGVYRNEASQRILIMAWAAKCNLSGFLEAETHHLSTYLPHSETDDSLNAR